MYLQKWPKRGEKSEVIEAYSTLSEVTSFKFTSLGHLLLSQNEDEHSKGQKRDDPCPFKSINFKNRYEMALN